MMSKKVPELRFKGFTDDWEERKLEDYSEKTFGGGTPKTGIDEYWTGDIPWIKSSDLKKEQLYNVQPSKFITDDAVKNSATKLVPKNSIAIVTRVGVGKLALLPFEYTTSQDFLSLSNLKVDKWFGIYSTYTMLQKELNNIQGTSIKGITKPELLKKKMRTPSLIEEQSKIGTFFKQLDDIIALHQRKLDLLKEQKKGFLQKMFPKNGAKVPELRFAGFADDWEERKLSDVANHRGGTAIEKYFDKDGEYKVISIGSYGLNSQYVDQNIRAISNEITDGRVVNSGELTMVLNDKTANGTIIGRTLLVEKDNEYVINQRTEIISPKENFDSNFAYTILNGSFREKVKRIVQGGTQIYVNYPAVSNLNLELPKIEEQQKIGSFFKQLDNTIALHQRKLDLLKEQKKGFLQKMFV